MDPFDFGKRVKEIHSHLPVILLATYNADIKEGEGIDKIFFWSGDPSLFIAIIKYVEDRINARYDTVKGNVRVLIMIEDSVRYYSMFLPLIYTEIVRQSQRLISEDLNELQRLLRIRVRPKILLAETFEEGMSPAVQGLYSRYYIGCNI
jgi:hypothetical protein